MKLLRLTSTDDEGIFNTQFNEEIVFKKGSKLALHSLTFDQIPREITIDDNTNGISVVYNDTYTGTADLNNNTYRADNVSFLLDDIQNKLNNTLTAEQSNLIGCEWKVEKNNDNKIQLTNYRSYPSNYEIPNILNNNEYVIEELEYRAKNEDEIVNLASYDYIAKGSGVYRLIKAYKEFTFGLISSDPKLAVNNYPNDPSIIYFGVEYYDGTFDPERQGTGYYVIFNGQDITYDAPLGYAVPSIPYTMGVSLNEPYEFYIEIINGELVLKYYSDSSPSISGELMRKPYNGDNLFPFVNLPTIPSGTLPSDYEDYRIRLQYTKSPLRGKNQEQYNGSPLLNFTPWKQNTFNQSITFESSELAKFLGFISPNLPTQKSTVENPLNYIAPYEFLLNTLNDSFIVELLDLKLDSYDSDRKGRFNILSVISSLEISEVGIVYEANNLIFIDLNLYADLNVRNLRLRILNRDGGAVNIAGKSVMTLLLKDVDE